jgi:ferredoxin
MGLLPIPGGPEEGAARLEVDWSRCDGHGLCAHILPEMTRLDGNGFPAFPAVAVPAWLEPQARRAVDMCPALALRLTGGSEPGAGPRSRDRRTSTKRSRPRTRR